MNDALTMDIAQCLTDFDREVHGSIKGKLFLVGKDMSQKTAADSFHDHVNAARIFSLKDLHHPWVVESLPNLLLTLEPIK